MPEGFRLLCKAGEVALPPVMKQMYRRLPVPMRLALANAAGTYAPWEAGFDFTPPGLLAGEVIGPPDFVGVGVQKAGTSWWYELILEHPDVYHRGDIAKERHYLTRFLDQPFGPAEIEGYHGWFPRKPGTVTGEWTPNYLTYPWVLPLLAEAAPDARILVALRDPVARFLSGFTFRLSMGAPHGVTTVADAYRQGFYARMLNDLYQWFPAEQVLVLQYEQMRNDPQHWLDQTFSFLGLDPFRPTEISREVNVTRQKRVELDPEARRRIVDIYRPDVIELRGLVPQLDVGLWPDFADLA